MPPTVDGSSASAAEEKARLKNILRDPNSRTDEPPGYFEGAANPLLSPASSSQSRDLPDIDFAAYRIPRATVSDDDGATLVCYEQATLSPDALMRLVLRQVSLPPKPIISIRGVPENGSRPLFELKLNVTNLLVRNASDAWNYVRVVSSPDSAVLGKLSLEQAVLRFCTEEASYKTLVLERRVINWDTEYLEGQIRNLTASLNFAGRVEIAFPTHFSRIVFQIGKEPLPKPFDTIAQWFSQKEAGKKPAKPRYSSEVCSFWPYATASVTQSEDVPRKFAVQSEQQYWNSWRGAIANAILSKRRGWVSTEDRIDALMGRKLIAPQSQWGRWDGSNNSS